MIEKRKYYMVFNDNGSGYGAFEDLFKNAPTVLEATEEQE